MKLLSEIPYPDFELLAMFIPERFSINRINGENCFLCLVDNKWEKVSFGLMACSEMLALESSCLEWLNAQNLHLMMVYYRKSWEFDLFDSCGVSHAPKVINENKLAGLIGIIIKAAKKLNTIKCNHGTTAGEKY